MPSIAIFYLIPGDRMNGGASYTAHLVRSFEQQGYTVRLLQVAAKTEQQLRPFVGAVQCQRVSLDDALRIAGAMPSFIAYAHYKRYPRETATLLAAGCGLVMHATAELYPEVLGLLRSMVSKVVVIRRAMLEHLHAAGVRGVFIPHPYVPEGPPQSALRRSHWGVALSRVDFAKYTNVIVEANLQLPATRHVCIYGPLSRPFVFHVLDRKLPEWRQFYGGLRPDASGVVMAASAHYVVDLTWWRGDGDGTQYTFLEAWDAGTPLVVNRRWVVTGRDAMRPGETCLVAGDAHELAAVLQSDPAAHVAAVQGGRAEMLKHAPAVVVPQYERWLNDAAN